MITRGTIAIKNIYTKHYFLVLLSLLFQNSCNESQVLKTNHGTIVKFNSVAVESIKEVSWKVGRKGKKKEVSKGFLVKISLPFLQKKDLSFLYETKRIDSWILKIERINPRWGRQLIGHFLIPIRVQTQKALRTSSSQSARFRIYYAAASTSSRFEQLPCPAFQHNLKITSLDFKNTDTPKKESFSLRRRSMVGGRVEASGFVSIEFNGGTSLKGEYIVSLALFNSVSKALMTEYIPVRSVISVKMEKPVPIPSCTGFTIPEKTQKKDNPLKKIWNK